MATTTTTPKVDQSIVDLDRQIMASFGFSTNNKGDITGNQTPVVSKNVPTPANLSNNTNNTTSTNNTVTNTGVNNNNGGSTFDADAERAKIKAEADASAQAFLANQTAIAQANLAQQQAQLKMAYEQAVAEGQISIRDAETQYAEQKQALEKQHYNDAQRTSLYGQEMGIQNSQQQIGLMQTDQARNQSLNNQNLSARDKRINDIKDRLNAISKQKDLDLANAQSQYNSAILGATGQADMMKSNTMLDFMKADYTANQQQAFAEKNMNTQYKYSLDLENVKQTFAKEMEAIGFDNRMKEIDKASSVRIKEMGVAHNFDLQKIQKAFENDVKMANINYGHSASLQSQSHKNQMAEISARLSAEITAEKKAYDLAVQRESAKYQYGTPEYNIRMGQLADDFDQKVQSIYTGAMVESEIKARLTATTDVGKPPTKVPSVIPGSTFINNALGYDQKKADYDKKVADSKKPVVIDPKTLVKNPYQQAITNKLKGNGKATE